MKNEDIGKLVHDSMQQIRQKKTKIMKKNVTSNNF